MTEFIQVFQVVDPGLTKWRGKMLYQLLKTKMFLSDVQHSKDIIDSKSFRLELENNLKGMEDVVECLKYEPEESSEYKIFLSAKVTITQGRELLSMIGFVST